ncbi:MAG TPA: hypothetical protein VIH15_03355 [Casimicrobiaceae bacterium]|jgi:hypothetical protein
MNRALTQSLMLVAGIAFAGMAGAEGGQPAPNAKVTQAHPISGPQSPGAAAPAVSGTELPAMGAEEPKRLPSTEVRGYREAPVACDRRQDPGSEACRAQLAAKYAEMDKLCRIVSGPEFPICIKSAYSAD